MVSIEELKKIYLLQNLTDKMLEKIVPHLRVLQCGDREIIFEEGTKAENFYMLKRGKILLEMEISDRLGVSLGSIKSGYSFGWSALLAKPSHTNHAVCAEPSDVFAIPGQTLRDILEGDPLMGYKVMSIAATILKNRLERRTAQLLNAIAHHPDMQKLLDSPSEEEFSAG